MKSKVPVAISLLALGLWLVPWQVGTADAQIQLRASSQQGIAPAASTVTFVGAGAQAGFTTSSITAPWPTGYTPTQNDFAVLIIAGRPGSGDLDPAAPTGWTGPRSPIQQTTAANPIRIVMYYKVLAGGDAAPTVSSTWTTTNAEGMSAQVAVWRGVNTTTPFDVADQTGTSAAVNPWTPPSISTVTSNALVVSAVATSDDNALAIGTANGFTVRMSGAAYDTQSGGDHSVGLADMALAAAGAATMLTWNQTVNIGTGAWAGITFALRPAPITLTINTPTGGPGGDTAVNDVMIASIGFRTNCCTGFSAAIGITPPANWNLVRRLDNATDTKNGLVVYWKVAVSGDLGSSHQWTFSCTLSCAAVGFQSAAGGIASFSGVDTSSPIDVQDGQNTVALAQTTPNNTISTTVANTMLVASHSYATATTAPWIQNSGMAPTGVDVVGGNQSTLMSYVIQVAAGLIGPKQATPTPDDDAGNAHILALRPPVVCAAPNNPAYVAATAQNGKVTVYWSSADSVLILRKDGGSVANTPANGTTYTTAVPQPWGAGGATVVYVGAAPATSFPDTGISNGTAYSFKVFPKTGTGGATCYASGVEVSGTPPSGTHPAWSYMMAGGSILEGGTTGNSTIYTTSNAGRIISLNTPTGSSGGTQVWEPVATTGAIQGYVTWLPLTWVRSIKTGPGTGAIAAGAASGTITISPGLTDTTKTILFFQASPGSDASPLNASVRCTLTNTTTITCDREGTTGAPAVNIRWQTVEFYGGVTVEHKIGADCDGVAPDVTLDGIVDVSINPVSSTANTFLLYSQKAQGGTHGSDDYRTVELINTSQVRITTALTGCITGYGYALQVVQYTGASVTRGLTGPMAAGITSVEVSLASVDPSKTILLSTWRTNSAAAFNVLCDRMVRGRIVQSPAKLVFSRGDGAAGCAGYAIDGIAYELIEFTDGTRVQQKQPAMAAGTGTADVPIAKVDTARTVVFAGGQYTGGQAVGEGSLSTDDIVGAMLGEHQLTTDSNLRVTRSDTSGTARWTSYVVEFPRLAGSQSVIGGDQTGAVYSVDVASGIQNWAAGPLAGITAVQAPPSAQLRGWSNQSFRDNVPDDLIFVVSRNATLDTANNKVYALRARDNGVQWTFDKFTSGASDLHYMSGMPYVDYARNRLYVASRAGTSGTQQSLWVIDTRNGSYVASFALGHLNGSPTLSYDQRTLYVGNEAGTLYALELGDPTLASPPAPTLKWGANPAALGTEIKGFVWEDYGTDGRLYFSTADGNVWRLDDPGSSPPANWWLTPAWKTKPVSTGTVSTPLPLDGAQAGLYVGGSDGKLYKLDLTTGAPVGTAFTVEAGVTVGNPSSENSTEVFVGTSAGRVYKIPLPLP